MSGYKAQMDFVKVIFDETDGLFCFLKKWEYADNVSIPAIPISEEAAVASAKKYSRQVMCKFGGLFVAYILGSLVSKELLIVAPITRWIVESKAKWSYFEELTCRNPGWRGLSLSRLMLIRLERGKLSPS